MPAPQIVHVNGSLSVGQVVYLYLPDNPRLHAAQAVVWHLTEYGAVVQCPTAATGTFRALKEEMTYKPVSFLSEMDTVVETMQPSPSFKAREAGYTGDVCGQCGGCKMRRNGSCLLCEDCGLTSGCS